ncbi:antistasin [Aplysia californica]|uniref:Antistasin n=1 Tax=Aplysia californica TaxID=6500 RepID=A0ABM0JH31_APLCA|nr:antistasin [Aplysia californica]
MAVNTAVVGVFATVFCLQAVSAFIPYPDIRCPQSADDCWCSHGPVNLISDRFGCLRCSCEPDPCPHECDYLCPHGNVKDKNGCNTCTCKPDPCPHECDFLCPHGNVKDKNGCNTCECLPGIKPFCPTVECGLVCPNGGFAQDSNGCTICACESDYLCPISWPSFKRICPPVA